MLRVGVVIVTSELRSSGALPSKDLSIFLGHGDYGGLLETSRYYRLVQGEVENVSEDTCQLFCACFEYTSW